MDSAAGVRLSPEGSALVEWFNYLPPTGARRVTIDDLSDGSKIWKALQQLDPDFFSSPLPEEAVRGTGRWLSAWGNLKHIYKHLADYVEHNGGRLPTGPGSVDLKKIAKGGEPEETIKARLRNEDSKQDETDYSVQLLQLLLFTAINAKENEDFIGAIMNVPQEKQLLLHAAIVELQNDSQTEEGAATTKPDSHDKDLFYEEQVGRLTQESNRLAREKRDLQRDLRDAHERNSRLQEHNGSLQEKLTAAEEKLEDSAENVGQSFLKEIEGKVHQQEELIANQETQLADAQRMIDNLRSESSKFRASHEKYQPLQDELDELRSERDQLARKANAIDKYKQKLQTMQDTEKENNHLRNALEESRELNQEGNKALDRVKVLQTTIDEYKKVIPTIEQELHEQRMIRKQSDYRAEEIGKRLSEANDQYQKDQAQISELIAQLESGAGRGEGSILENELTKDSIEENELVAKCTLAWSRMAYLARFADIKTQNEQLMKTTNEREGRIAMLESMLAVAKQRNANLEEQIDEALRKPNDRFDSFPNLLPGPSYCADSPSRDGTRKDADKLELEKERAVFQRQLEEQAQKGKQYTNFTAVMEAMAETGDIVVINRTDLRRLQENQGAVDELRAKGAENAELQRRIKDLETQVNQHQAMLSDTIKGPGAEGTLKLIEAATKDDASQKADKQDAGTYISMLLEDLMKGQQTLQERAEQNSRLEREVHELKEQIAQMRAAPGIMKASEQ
ncbi:MAG: hypothetical protein LQ340_005144, partial [Diploschistes diacapsis]